MPQARNTRAPVEVPKSADHAEGHEVWSPVGLIWQAKQLEADRVAHQKKITQNRTQLRTMDGIDALTEDQGLWLDAFYPEKEKGKTRTKEEVEATRKLHAEAVKEVSGAVEAEEAEEAEGEENGE